MSFRIDAKGKIFTDIVRKDEVPVTIQTVTNLVHGHIFLRPEQRIKDELNSSQDQFIAVTDAEVYGLNGQLLYRSEFLTFNKQHIIWLRPDDEPPEQPTASGT